MKVKWEARFKLNEKEQRMVLTGFSKERDVRARVKKEHPELTDKDIYVSGAFEPIWGKRLILGTHAINSSLDLGWPYSKSGNLFYELIDPQLEQWRKVIESQNGTHEAEEAKTSILRELQSKGVGLADIIDYCFATSSKDQDISTSEHISWNKCLPELIRKADVIYLNGKEKNKKGPLYFLRQYCKKSKGAGLKVKGDRVFINDREVECHRMYSSSCGVHPEYYEQRKKDWEPISSLWASGK